MLDARRFKRPGGARMRSGSQGPVKIYLLAVTPVTAIESQWRRKVTIEPMQVARAFMLSGVGLNTAPDIKFSDRFIEPAVRTVLDHAEIGDVKPWAELMVASMQGALLARESDPSPVEGYLDMQEANYHRAAYAAMREALAKIRDSKEVAGEHRLKASDLLGEVQ
jgi:hypothetical protein